MDFKWKKEYETGFVEIDLEHQQFFKIIERLYNVVPKANNDDEILDIISEFKSYTLYHFKTEEDLFEKYAYPEKEKTLHQNIHKNLCKSLDEFEMNETESMGILGYKLAQFARDWLIDHILKTDMTYIDFLKTTHKI
jgi:hemerythrin-like metal-binding protein